MSGVNQAPPSPTTLPPLRQAVDQVKQGQMLNAQTPVPAPAPQPVQQQGNNISKVRTSQGIIPSSMKKLVTNQPEAQQNPVQQPPIVQQPQPVPPPQPQMQQQVHPPVAPTYYEGGDNISGFIEFDLQSYRQRGVEERFLSISVLGLIEEVDIEDQEIANQVVNQVSRTSMRISDRAQFEALKDFFARLEWEG